MLIRINRSTGSTCKKSEELNFAKTNYCLRSQRSSATEKSYTNLILDILLFCIDAKVIIAILCWHTGFVSRILHGSRRPIQMEIHVSQPSFRCQQGFWVSRKRDLALCGEKFKRTAIDRSRLNVILWSSPPFSRRHTTIMNYTSVSSRRTQDKSAAITKSRWSPCLTFLYKTTLLPYHM